jgi:glyoxylase-like metal-dependent hydrolase (beta-lactamase superfamily II)
MVAMRAAASIARLVLGSFIRPATETGSDRARAEIAVAYLVRHPDGLVLFDTGIGVADPETEAHYQPSRVALSSALGDVGVGMADVDLVANCHLHFDHCGGNPLLAGKPIIVQRTELELARAGGYTVDELVDHPGVRYDVIDGEVEPLPGLLLVPTPGHTAGHQSLAVLTGDARSAGASGAPPPPPWMDRLLDLDPVRVHFAQDTAVWYPA